MNAATPARGNATRQANKELRRQRILDVARELIASEGFDDFTLSELAARSGVSVPTIHNLFGRKYDIFRELCTEMVVRIEEVMASPDLTDPIASAEAFIDSLLNLYRDDEAFYLAAFVAGERTKLFEHEMANGIFRKSLKIAEGICARAVDNGYLQGNIDSSLLAEQLFGCQRLARQDWVNGYIGLEQYRRQVLAGMFMIYAADATPAFHRRLCEEIEQLKTGA